MGSDENVDRKVQNKNLKYDYNETLQPGVIREFDPVQYDGVANNKTQQTSQIPSNESARVYSEHQHTAPLSQNWNASINHPSTQYFPPSRSAHHSYLRGQHYLPNSINKYPYHYQPNNVDNPNQYEPYYIPHAGKSKPQRDDRWALTSTLAVSAGTLVGLTTAAALRWLGGDDWYFISPRQNYTTSAGSHTLDKACDNQTSCSIRNEDCSTIDELNESSKVKKFDEKQPLHSTSNGVTDQAMDFLRKQQQQQHQQFDDNFATTITENSQLAMHFRHIQESLRVIQSSIDQGFVVKGEVDDAAGVDDDKIRESTFDSDLQLRICSALSELESILKVLTVRGDKETTKAIIPNIDIVGAIDIANVVPDDIATQSKSHSIKSEEISANLVESTSYDATSSIEKSSATKTALHEALTLIVLRNATCPRHRFLSGVNSLYLFAANLSKNPFLPRYRRIYCDNENYRNYVESLHGASELLSAIGFQKVKSSHLSIHKYWEWMPLDSPRMCSDVNDLESVFSERLREAVLALEKIKEVSDNTTTEELLEHVLIAAGLQGTVTSDNNDTNTSECEDPVDLSIIGHSEI